ncbi:MAG: hypothetical protein GPJ00_04510 [Microcystis aeruginosa W13-18]|uniref:hypothetical protein n=1 Tax=Microcystis sp. M058S1 TaxID=2771123 RepID=UPI002586EE7E|nr:hypothetical protein [Microcystis sp. M058S1]NCQ83807.1 hypothetical protein [Microcystis aeruginosa W13-18]NCR48174.1 hypothetical protein [Microcystis aeruginosa S11-01]NCS76021.1 hypothetical protein [Microcystis aeruginosa K13-07]
MLIWFFYRIGSRKHAPYNIGVLLGSAFGIALRSAFGIALSTKTIAPNPTDKNDRTQ